MNALAYFIPLEVNIVLYTALHINLELVALKNEIKQNNKNNQQQVYRILFKGEDKTLLIPLLSVNI